MKNFKIQPTIYFSENALDRLKEIETKRTMIITDPFVVTSGMIKLITDPLKARGIDHMVFDDVVPDAPLDKISHGVDEFLKYQPDCVISVGGGSAIDSAKAIREIAKRADKSENASKHTKLIAIPTTSGTGSEVTSFAVINDTVKHIKYPLVSDSLLCDEAILDAELVKSVPPAITAATGMDVVTHALEAYVSNKHNEFSSALSEKVLEICNQFLLRAYYDGNDQHARKKMHIASCMAGLAFNDASLGINHSIAHQLGAVFHIPHGQANAMLLPYVIEFNSDIHVASRSKQEYLPAVERYVNAAHVMGLASNSPIMGIHSLITWCKFMMREMSMPTNISKVKGIDAATYFSQIDTIAENALNDACTPTNPRVPTKEDIKKILERLWDGTSPNQDLKK